MGSYTYKYIVERARTVKKNVEKSYKIGINTRWSYYFAKAIIMPNKDIIQPSFTEASKPTGDNLSRQVLKKDYIDMAKRLISYVDKNKTLPNYISIGDKKMRVNDYCYMFARIVVYYADKKAYPNYAQVNSKAFTKPSETTNEVYEYFKDVFGSFGDTIDGALGKVASKGYGYYYDDKYSNKESINRMKAGKGVNCTDSCQVFYNIMLALIKKGKYKKVECLHIKCRGGDGHVRLRITLADGKTTILRDPASVLNGNGVTSNWCLNGTTIAVDPAWFKANLNR